MQSTRLMVNMVLNERQPASMAEEQSTVRVGVWRERTKDGLGTVMSEIRKPGVLIHRWQVVRIYENSGEKDEYSP